MLDIRHLRQIIAIHQAGSLAKAAERLGMAQPSLSNSIARLEDELGVKIFDRTTAGTRLTPIGEMLLARAPKVIAEADDMLRDADLVANGEGGEIRIGFGTALRDSFLPELLVQLAAHHPQLRLSVSVEPGALLVQRLVSRQLDVIVCAQNPDLADLPFIPVFACDFIPAVSRFHPLASKSAVKPEELLRYACASSTDSFGDGVVLGADEEYENAIAYRANDFDSLAQLAKSGLCVLIAPACSIHRYLRQGDLVSVDLDLGSRVMFGVAATRAMSLSPIVRKIIGYAVATGADMQLALPRLSRREPDPEFGLAKSPTAGTRPQP